MDKAFFEQTKITMNQVASNMVIFVCKMESHITEMDGSFESYAA